MFEVEEIEEVERADPGRVLEVIDQRAVLHVPRVQQIQLAAFRRRVFTLFFVFTHSRLLRKQK